MMELVMFFITHCLTFLDISQSKYIAYKVET